MFATAGRGFGPIHSLGGQPMAGTARGTGATNYYLKVTSEKQGWIRGSCMQKGQQDLIEVESWGWGVQSPRDAASGLATGKRQHKPIVFRSFISKASPLL